MKIIIAPDSFKESCTAQEATEAIAQAALKVFGPDANLVKVPMADGGEGTVQSLVDATGGHILEIEVQGPLGDPVLAHYGITGDGKTAIIEMASASGLHLVPKDKRNPLVTSTYGTGQLIVDALDRGITSFVLGIGGSATNDGGSGMATALGYRFLDPGGNALAPGGGSLDRLASIDRSGVHPSLQKAHFDVACDVSNPLCDPEGASHVFGPQKGASPDMVQTLDQNLLHYSQVLTKELGTDIAHLPGAGAAGGLGAGLLAFCPASLRPGVDIVIETTGLKEKAKGADLCITGEGQIDFQTKYGKTPYGAMKAVKDVSPHAKVVAIAGSLGDRIEELYDLGFDGIFSITPGASDLPSLYQNVHTNISRTAEAIFRLIQ